jgi:uncharacterized repeat protein (TIGR01451 family)/LPXTG-motif cell wall-anchored protein
MKRKLFGSIKKPGTRILAILMLTVLVFSILPNNPGSFAAFDNTNAIEEKTGAADTPQTLSDGQVWTGKSVDANPATSAIDEVVDPTLVDDKFGVTLSALGQNYKTTTEGGIQPVNVVLVLDVSGSMDSSKLSNMVTSANQVIDLLLPSATGNQNKVGIVTFDDNASSLVSLRNTKFDLSTSSSDSNTFRVVSGINATNVQSGMNYGYDMLESAKSGGDAATPVMIVLTDGGTWYYRTDYKTIPTGSSGWLQDTYNGNGTSNGNGLQAAAYTIIQAAYLKTQMPELKMYTIGFDVGSNVLIKATLDPTTANINAVTGGSTASLGERLASIDTADTEYTYDYHYPQTGGAYLSGVTPGELVGSFLQALGDITNNIAPLKQGTNLVVTDTISDDFMLSPSGNLVVNLGGMNYVLTGSGGVYTNASLSGLSVTNVDGELTWTIPANLVPMNSYNTSGATPVLVTANPITLNFKVELDNVTSAGTYYTNYDETPGALAGAKSIFTPVAGNPYYYDSVPGTTPTYPTGDWEVTVSRTWSGGSWRYALTSLKQNGVTIQYVSHTITDVRTNGSGNANRCDISATLTDGTIVSFNDVAFNPAIGSSSTNVRTENGLTASIDDSNTQGTSTTYTQKPGVGFIPTTDNVQKDMPNTGMIKLRTNVGSLTFGKEVEAYDGEYEGNITSFVFTVNVAGFNGTGNVYNSSNVQLGSFTITNGTGQVTLQDSQYAQIKNINIGTQYSVDEQDYSGDGYVKSFTGNPSGQLADLANPIIFTNTYYPTATIDITKAIDTLYDSVTIPSNVTFPFGLYSYNETTQTYTKIDGVSASISTSAAPYSAQMTVMIKKLADLGLFGTGSSATVYVHEESMAGDPEFWTNDSSYKAVTIGKDGSVQYPDGATFTNDYVPKTTLTLTKATAGGTAPDNGFDFTIKLGETGGPSFNYSYIINRSNGTTEPGSGTAPCTIPVSLGTGDNIFITGIPVGAHYEIEEADYSAYGFNPSVGEGQRLVGNALAGGNSVTVTNTLYTNDIKVSKTIVGGDPNADFTFTLYKGQNVVTGYTYEIGDSSFTAGSGTFTLKGGQTATLRNLPVGTTYTVVETANTAYQTESKLNSGSYAAVNSVDVPLTFGSSEVPELSFKNTYKTGSLNVSKSVLVDDNAGTGDETYTVEVTFTGGYLAGITTDGATKIADGKYTAELANGGSATFSGVPAGATYVVEETANQGADSVTYSPDQTGTISADTQASVLITNSFLTPATLTISKAVNNANNPAFADSTAFSYEIFFEKEVLVEAIPAVYEDETLKTPEVPAHLEWAPYVLALDEMPAGLAAGTLTGYYTFSLTDGASIEFSNLPVGVRFQVIETNNGGARAAAAAVTSGNATVDSSDALKVTGSIVQDSAGAAPISIQYANDFSVTPGTLTLTKTLSDLASVHNDDDGFDFIVEFTGQTTGITCSDTTILPVTDAVNPMTFAVTLNASESVSFDGLLNNTQYKITELTKDADSTVFTNADSTGTNEEGQATASGTMVQTGWTVGDVTVDCANTYNPPKTTTEKTTSPADDENNTVVAKNVDVTYTVIVTNTSAYTIELSSIEDNMLANAANVQLNGSAEGFTIDLNTEDGTPTPRLVLNENLEMAPGAWATMTYTVQFSSFGAKDNTATSFAYYGEYEITSYDTTTVTVDPDSSIDVDKQVKYTGDYSETATADYNETVTYKVTITNSGEAGLSSIKLSDALFADTSIDSITAMLGDSTLYTEKSGNEMQFFTDEDHEHPVTLSSGQSIVLTYTVKADDDYINTATVRATAGIHEVEDSDSASVTIKTPTIDVTKTGEPASALVGESVDYQVRIVNTYDRALDLVSISDTFFKGSTDYTISNIAYSIGGGTPIEITASMIDANTGSVSFAVGDSTEYPSFGPQDAVVLSYTVTFYKAGTYVNTAAATAQYNGKNAVDSDSAGTSVTVQVNDPTIGFTVDKRVNGQKDITVPSGTVVTYTVTVANTGNVPLNLNTLQDPMFASSGLTITSLELNDGTTTTPLSYVLNGDVIEINYPGESWLFLEPGSSVTLTYTRAMSSTYTNTVTANLYKGDETPLSEQSSATVRMQPYYPPVDPTPTPTPTPTPSPTPSPSPTPDDEDTGVLGDSDTDEDAAPSPAPSDAAVAGDSDKLPQTGGVSASTILGLLGLVLAATGVVTLTFRRKRSTK